MDAACFGLLLSVDDAGETAVFLLFPLFFLFPLFPLEEASLLPEFFDENDFPLSFPASVPRPLPEPEFDGV